MFKCRSVLPVYFCESLLYPPGFCFRMFCVAFLMRNVALIFASRNNFVSLLLFPGICKCDVFGFWFACVFCFIIVVEEFAFFGSMVMCML